MPNEFREEIVSNFLTLDEEVPEEIQEAHRTPHGQGQQRNRIIIKTQNTQTHRTECRKLQERTNLFTKAGSGIKNTN